MSKKYTEEFKEEAVRLAHSADDGRTIGIGKPKEGLAIAEADTRIMYPVTGMISAFRT